MRRFFDNYGSGGSSLLTPMDPLLGGEGMLPGGSFVPGEKMANGSIYAGISPDTGRLMFVAAADAPAALEPAQAETYASGLDAHGRKDWRIPTIGELNVLFNNRAAIGGFDLTGQWPGGWYQSSTQSKYLRPVQKRFDDGTESDRVSRGGPAALRCVCG
jgi:hypothetical protein